MRIDAYNQVAQLYNTDKAAKTPSTKSIKGAARDEVQISSFGHDYQVAKQAVTAASDIRDDKVAQVAAKVNFGNYNVSADEFAAKLFEKYNSLL